MDNGSRAHEMWARALWAVADVAERGGIPAGELFAGLSFDAATARRRRRVSWEEFCIVIERVETLAGGVDSCRRLFEENYPFAFPELRTFAAATDDPKALFQFVAEALLPLLFPMITTDFADAGPGRVHVRMQLVPGARHCLAFFSGSAGFLGGLTRHLDLPPAEVTVEASPAEGAYDIRLPLCLPLAAVAAGQARSRMLGDRGLRVILGYRDDGIGLGVTIGQHMEEAGRRVEELARAWTLTRRQAQVFEQLVRGCANKEIAMKLGCAENTVELHVTQLLRKAGVGSRAQLTARFWSGK